MISALSHATVFVLDQDSAKAFYTEKLGMELREDISMGEEFEGAGAGFRWLTVGPPHQPDVELILSDCRMGHDPSNADAIRALVAKGAFGVGVLRTKDCRATYEELAAKGVRFQSPPVERPYGTEAMLQDDSGNYFSLVQRPHQGTHQGTR